jgi:hypothetical protein
MRALVQADYLNISLGAAGSPRAVKTAQMGVRMATPTAVNTSDRMSTLGHQGDHADGQHRPDPARPALDRTSVPRVAIVAHCQHGDGLASTDDLLGTRAQSQ